MLAATVMIFLQLAGANAITFFSMLWPFFIDHETL